MARWSPEKNAEIWTQLICLQSHHSNNASSCFRSKKKLVKEKTIKIEKTRQHNSSAVDFPSTMYFIYVQLGDNNQVVSYAEEIWWNFAHPLLIDAMKTRLKIVTTTFLLNYCADSNKLCPIKCSALKMDEKFHKKIFFEILSSLPPLRH